jgi:hypothetical protein
MGGMEYRKEEEGCCITCGFAAKRAEIPTDIEPNVRFFEIELEERESGLRLSKSVSRPSVSSLLIRCEIACLRRAKDLTVLARMLAKPDWPDSVRERCSLEVLRNESGCKEWYPYEPGRTPKDHLADYMWERLEKDRRRFEMTLWRYNRMAERRFQKTNKRLVIIGIFFGAIFTALQIIIPLTVHRESAVDRLIRLLFAQ